MKLLITSNKDQTTTGFTTITAFEEFRKLVETKASEITDIRITSFLLGMACVYWMIDHARDVMKRINFVLSVDSQDCNEAIKQMIKRYLKEKNK